MQPIRNNSAIAYHSELGTLRAVGSFRPDERKLFEALFACWSMLCIYVGGDRYLLEAEYNAFSVGDDWDKPTIEADYATVSAPSGYDVVNAAQAELAGVEQFALGEKERLAQSLNSLLSVDLADNLFAHATRICNLWNAAAVVASQFATSDHFVALGLAATRFENAILSGANHINAQSDFHRALLEMAAPSFASDFDRIWPRCRVILGKRPEHVAIVRQLRDALGGCRGEPYGSNNPVHAMSSYLRQCDFA